MINDKNIPSKIEKINLLIEKNKINEKIIENLTILEEPDIRLPLKIRKKINKIRMQYKENVKAKKQNVEIDNIVIYKDSNLNETENVIDLKINGKKFSKDKKQEIINEFNEYKNKLIYKYKKSNANYRAKIRRLQNLKEWNELNKEEKIQRETDLSFYRANILSYWLCLSTILFDGLYIVYMLKIMERNFWIGIFIIVNIAILLFLFTSAIKIKNYKKLFCYLIIIFGIYSLIRILFVIKYVMQVPLNEAITSDRIIIYGTNIYCFIVSIFIGVSSYIKIKRKEEYIEENKISFKQMSK